MPLRVADLVYDTRRRLAQRGGQTMTFTASEASVLEFLMHNQGTVCSREAILAGALAYLSHSGTNVVDQNIHRIRAKAKDLSKPKLIYNVRKVGYVIRAEPEWR